MCCQAAGDTDNYQIVMSQGNMTPVQKANLLGTAVHGVEPFRFARDSLFRHLL